MDASAFDGGAVDAATDATMDDAAMDATLATDAATDANMDDGAVCAPPARTDYTCTADPASCPGGTCISALCLGPTADPMRWASCGDGTCGSCETPASCPADCGTAPVITGTPVYDPATTITVEVHGLSVTSSGSVDALTYGDAIPWTSLETQLHVYAPTLPDGLTDPTAPNQLVGVEYYGTHAASSLSATEVSAIEAYDPHTEEALARYALILATFIQHRLAMSGATGAAIVCHSMGCHITRYMIEHDLDGLASSGKIPRIVGVAGAFAGAELAKLFDNPTVAAYAALVPINTTDFVHLNPDFVTDNSAIWDHRATEANNPLWHGILIHQVTGTNPTAGGIAPLDPVDPTDEPNDSVLFEQDTFFVSQAPAVQLVAPDGTHLSPSHTWRHVNHTTMEGDPGALALAAAGLYHRRRVTITIRQVMLFHDHESHGDPLDFTDFGTPPADLVPDVTVRFDPYLPDTFAVTGAVIGERQLDDRSPALFHMFEGDTLDAEQVVFDGPVMDGMTTLSLDLDLREVDSFPRYGITELPSGEGSVLASFSGDVPLVDGSTFELSTADIDAMVEVHVHDLY